MKLKILFLILFNFMFGKIHSQEFYFLGKTRDEESVYGKIQEASSYNNEVKVWVKFISEIKNIKSKSGKLIKIGGEQNFYLFNIKCSKHQYDKISAIKYNSKGKVIDKMIYPDYNLDVIPETIMETIYEFACE